METEQNARRLRAVNGAAHRLGLRAGTRLTDALAVHPGLNTAPAEPETEAQALRALSDWCVRYSPAVALDPPDGLFLEVSGVQALWGETTLDLPPPEGGVGEADLQEPRSSPSGGGRPRSGGGGSATGAVCSLLEPPIGRQAGLLPPGGRDLVEQAPPSDRRPGLFNGDWAEDAAQARVPAEAALLADLLARLEARGLPAFGAVAATPGAAWALARFGGAERDTGEGSDRDRLAPLPVAGLRLDADTAHALDRLGLRTIGQVAALPRGQAAKRFGRGLLLRLDQAFGEVEEALVYRRPPSPWFARRAFAEPISAPQDLARATGDILGRLCRRLETEGRGARRFTLAFHRLDGRVFPLVVGVALAGRDPLRLARLFAPRLEAIDPGFGIEVVTLSADRVEALAPVQVRLAEAGAARGETGLADLVDRLQARLGEASVWRAEVRESWVPERAVARAAPFAPKPSGDVPRGWDPARPRPIRLFARPEPIEAMAPVPDDPPVQFRWRGRLHRVRAAEGPERLAEEWWRKPIGEVGAARVRDYYRVEDGEGARFWIFRAGLYSAEAPSRWFVHGLFG